MNFERQIADFIQKERAAGSRANDAFAACRCAEDLNARKLADEIKRSFGFQPAKLSLDVNGGASSAQILKNLLQKKHAPASWLAPVRRILEKGGEEIRIFFRDDDAGIGEERLFALLNIFEKYRVPLDLAVIPKAVSAIFAENLRARIRASNNLFAIHQHGFAHTNHKQQ